MNSIFDDVSPDEFGTIFIPSRSARDARASLLGPDGGESYLIAQDRKFSLLNHVEAAGHAVSYATAEATRLERQLQRIERNLAWTPAMILTPLQTPKLSRASLALALVFAAFGALGMIVSNVVLSEYVLRSANDLFANNVTGAVLFATLPCLGAVAAKAFEQRLVSADARRYFSMALFAVGMTSLAIWLPAAAMTFAPDVTGSLALLAHGRNDNLVNMVLVLTTIVCDVTLGASILSGVGHLLASARNSKATANPNYRGYCAEKIRLEALIAKCVRRRAVAEDYLSRAAAGRELTRREAEHDLNRARELWTQAQTAALAFAIAVFLSVEEETP